MSVTVDWIGASVIRYRGINLTRFEVLEVFGHTLTRPGSFMGLESKANLDPSRVELISGTLKGPGGTYGGGRGISLYGTE